MRELKFREWLPDLKRFHYWGLIDGGFVGPCEPKGKHGQMTTLKDKNRNEIFEGDIIKLIVEDTQEPSGHCTTHNEVAFRNGCFGWIGEQTGILHPFDNEDAEVIGNIYANPELLSPAG